MIVLRRGPDLCAAFTRTGQCHFNALLSDTCSSSLLLGKQHLWPSAKYFTIKPCQCSELFNNNHSLHSLGGISKLQTITRICISCYFFLISFIVKINEWLQFGKRLAEVWNHLCNIYRLSFSYLYHRDYFSLKYIPMCLI